jgi:hypothetical protein
MSRASSSKPSSAKADAAGLMSREHFTVDGTLIEAWASLKSFRPKDEKPGDRPPPDDPGNPTVNFRGEKRSNVTHQSTTDPESRLARAFAQRALDGFAFSARQACRLRIALGESFTLAGKLVEAQETGALAAAAARALGDAELVSRAALVDATEARIGTRDEAAVRWLREALSMLPAEDSAMRARVMARLAVAMLPAPPDEHDDALRLSEEAVAMARRLGDDETLFTALSFTRMTPSATEDLATRFALNGETIALAKRFGQVAHIAPLFSWQVAACVERGEIDAALRQADEMEALLAAYEQPIYRYRAPLVRAILADLEGRFAEADALSRHGTASGLRRALPPKLSPLPRIRVLAYGQLRRRSCKRTCDGPRSFC